MTQFLWYAFRIPALWGHFWRRMHLIHSGKQKEEKKKRKWGKKKAENPGAAAALWVRPRCWILLLPPHPKEVHNSGSQMLLISEPPSVTVSSGGVRMLLWHPWERNKRHFSTICLRATALSRAEWGCTLMSTNWSGTEEVMFSWHFSKVMQCFFLAENNIKGRNNDQREKRGREKPALHSLSLFLREKCCIDCLLGYFVNTRGRTDLVVCPNLSKTQIREQMTWG